MREKGQIHAIEGIFAAIVLILSLVFALQVSAVTPMTESTSSQHIENQQKAVGQDLLQAGSENDSLKPVLTYWDLEQERYHDPDTDGIATADLRTELEFGSELATTLTDRGIAFNLHVNYLEDGTIYSRTVVNQGEPSDHAVTATTMVTLYESDRFYDSDGSPTETTLAEGEDDFYIPNEGSGPVYNVAEMELVIWRM
ncbi:hypothetical protein ACLI4Z_04185 [Natrialbaceae archaeon A-arb3/5]